MKKNNIFFYAGRNFCDVFVFKHAFYLGVKIALGEHIVVNCENGIARKIAKRKNFAVRFVNSVNKTVAVTARNFGFVKLFKFNLGSVFRTAYAELFQKRVKLKIFKYFFGFFRVEIAV